MIVMNRFYLIPTKKYAPKFWYKKEIPFYSVVGTSLVKNCYRIKSFLYFSQKATHSFHAVGFKSGRVETLICVRLVYYSNV